MPIYEFICKACGKEFETILSSTDTSTVICENCGSGDVTKVLSAPCLKVHSGPSASPQATSPGCGRSGFS